MSLSVTGGHLKRYKDILKLLFKYGKKDILEFSKIKDNLDLDEFDNESYISGDPDEFANDLEKMGPTFIKLGQLLSSRPDFLPIPYIKALSRLQDKVEPFSFEEVENTIMEELGVRISKAYLEFNPIPIAAASLGQVHQAKLRDGRDVAVKVQRPNIHSIVLEDLAALEEIADTFDKHTELGKKYGFTRILNEFRKTILQEMDYKKEAQNLLKLNDNLQSYEKIVVPKPVIDYTTSRVLTMDFVKGTKITKLSPLAKLDLNGAELADELFKAYLDQVLVDGFFHADPHPGNVFITDDNKLALIDLGMVAHIDPAMRENLLKLLLFISNGRGDEAAKISMRMSFKKDDFNEAEFTKEVNEFVAQYQDATLEQIKVGRVIVELARIAASNGIRTSAELTMLGKTLLNLDEIGKILEPQFNPNEIIKKHSENIMQKHMLQNLSPGNFFSSILELNEFVQKLPGRLNTLFDNIANNNLELRIKTFDEDTFMRNIMKIANRFALGVILASLIVGAALMMRVDTQFKLFGYPGFAVILFIIAAACGFGLMISIVVKDKPPSQNKKPI